MSQQGKIIFRNVTIVLSFIAIVLSACSQQVERPPLKIGWTLFPGYYPMAILGDLASQDNETAIVKPVYFPQYADMLIALQSGELDGTLLTMADALLLDAQSPGNLRVIMAVDYSIGGDVIVASADIQTLADLQGKTVGVSLGSFGELFAQQMLKANGMKIGDVNFINIPPDGVPAALSQSIQAGHTWEPYTTESLTNGAHIIYSSADQPGLISDVLVVRSAIADQRPEDLRAFVAAWFAALNDWQANPAEGNAVIAAATGQAVKDISTEGLQLLSLQDNQVAFTPSDAYTSLYGSGRVNIEFLAGTGGISFQPDLEQLLDPSFLK